jgi:hypothetical protein
LGGSTAVAAAAAAQAAASSPFSNSSSSATVMQRSQSAPPQGSVLDEELYAPGVQKSRVQVSRWLGCSKSAATPAGKQVAAFVDVRTEELFCMHGI